MELSRMIRNRNTQPGDYLNGIGKLRQKRSNSKRTNERTNELKLTGQKLKFTPFIIGVHVDPFYKSSY